MPEIMNGKGDYYPGLIPLIYAYLEHINCDDQSFARIEQYLTLIQRRASGELQTAASWMRTFVKTHPDYNHDSVVSDTIAHDLVDVADQIGKGTLRPAELLGDAAAHITPVTAEHAYGSPLAREKISHDCRSELIRSITTARQSIRARDAHAMAEERKAQYHSDMSLSAEIGLIDF